MICYAFNIMIPNFVFPSNSILGSSLTFSAQGGKGEGWLPFRKRKGGIQIQAETRHSLKNFVWRGSKSVWLEAVDLSVSHDNFLQFAQVCR